MNKIIFFLASVIAAVTFTSEALAVPAFARQTGMACYACHAQHFPVLSSFGRAFKADGFTMMGSQGKVEGEHLSIPDTLNASVVMKIRYQKDNTLATTGDKNIQPQKLGDGQWQFFDEFTLLFGGRVAENIGFLLEAQMIDPAAPMAASFKMPFVFDMGAAKVSVVPFTTDALGVQYGYEQSSGGVLRSNRWSEHRRETSAIQYNADRGADGGAATGVAFAVQNDMGFINVSKFAAVQGGGSNLSSTYFRVAATPSVGDWAMVVGLGKMSGRSFVGTTTATTYANNPLTNVVTATNVDTDVAVDTVQTFIDFQMQGEVAGSELGVYAQYAKAPAGTNGFQNAYNSSTNTANPDRKAMTIGADYSVIPHVLSIGAAYRKAETGGAVATNGDNAITLTAVYDVAQNVALHANYSKYSGSKHDAATAVTSLYTLMLEAAW